MWYQDSTVCCRKFWSIIFTGWLNLDQKYILGSWIVHGYASTANVTIQASYTADDNHQRFVCRGRALRIYRSDKRQWRTKGQPDLAVEGSEDTNTRSRPKERRDLLLRQSTTRVLSNNPVIIWTFPFPPEFGEWLLFRCCAHRWWYPVYSKFAPRQPFWNSQRASARSDDIYTERLMISNTVIHWLFVVVIANVKHLFVWFCCPTSLKRPRSTQGVHCFRCAKTFRSVCTTLINLPTKL